MEKFLLFISVLIMFFSVNFLFVLNRDSNNYFKADRNELQQKYENTKQERIDFATRHNQITNEISKKEIKIKKELQDLEYLKKVDGEYKKHLEKKNRELDRLKVALFD